MAYLKFNNLPTQIRERLLSRERGEGEGFVFKTAGVVSSYILIALAVIWFLLLFYLSDDYLWSRFQIIFFSLISFTALYVFLYSFYRLWRWFTSKSKFCLLITPAYVIDIYFNDVNYWNLEQLIAVNNIHRYESGRYKFSEITLTLENDSKTFNINDLETAEQTVEQISYFRKLFIEATVRNNTEYIDSNDDFRELKSQNIETEKVVHGNILQRIVTFSGAVVLMVGVMFSATALNNYFDDKKSWDTAQTVNRASSYRTYLETHQQGRWTSEANLKLQTLYDEAEQKYQASLNQGFDRKAADAVLQVLKYAKTTENYHVKVVFERINKIPPNIVEKLKKEQDVKNLLPIGETFTEEQMSKREGELFNVIADAFRQIIPDDILELSKDCSGECALFLVKYKINSDSTYYDTRQENVAEADRIYYPGIFIDWDFGVQTPNQPQIYSFILTSNPAQTISYGDGFDNKYDPKKDFAEILKSELGTIYDSMVSSAFDDFKTNLLLKTGIANDSNKAVNLPNEGTDSATTKKSRK
jgi:hypothetical protein